MFDIQAQPIMPRRIACTPCGNAIAQREEYLTENGSEAGSDGGNSTQKVFLTTRKDSEDGSDLASTANRNGPVPRVIRNGSESHDDTTE